MIKPWLIYTRTAGQFLAQAWRRDLVNQVNKTLPAGQTHIDSGVDCAHAVAQEQAALKVNPPVDSKTNAADEQVLGELRISADSLDLSAESNICQKLTASPTFLSILSRSEILQRIRRSRTSLSRSRHLHQGSPFSTTMEAMGYWAPVLTSTPYYAVVSGVTDLSTKQNWTQLLNTGIGDIALYYKSLAFGLEGGYGQTVQIVQQNVCKNTISGTITAQQCAMAMLGKPNPKNSWIAAGTLQLAPLAFLAQGTALRPGAQIQFSYSAPTSGGHSSEIALPLYLLPSISKVSFVVVSNLPGIGIPIQ